MNYVIWQLRYSKFRIVIFRYMKKNNYTRETNKINALNCIFKNKVTNYLISEHREIFNK